MIVRTDRTAALLLVLALCACDRQSPADRPGFVADESAAEPAAGVGASQPGISDTGEVEVLPSSDAEPGAQSPSAGPTTGQTFGGTAGVTDRPGAVRGVATLTEVRTGRHGTFDRVVFEFAGAELPGYHIEYIDRPVRQCGSGNVVPLAGDGWLQVRFQPAQAHDDQGRPTVADRERAPVLPVLKELELVCDFEAHVEWVLGVAAPNRYRVLELSAPTRLVVDIQHR